MRVVPFDLLGSRLTDDKALVDYGTAPDASIVLVDPAKLACIQNGPRGAGIASAYIYKCIGMGDDDAFPQEVKLAVTKTGDAKYHAYGPDKDMHVLHAAGPDFTRGSCTLEDAVAQLAQAYCNIFSELATSKLRALRMLPVSYGSNAGKLVHRISHLTPVAIYQGCAMLTPELRDCVSACDISLCIPIENHVDDFKKSLWLAQAMAAQHAAAVPAPVRSALAPPVPAASAAAPMASLGVPASSMIVPSGPTASLSVPLATLALPGGLAPPSAWGSVLQTVKTSVPLPVASTSPICTTPFDAEEGSPEVARSRREPDEYILDLF